MSEQGHAGDRDPMQPTGTEDAPATPGWVEAAVDEALRELPTNAAVASLRDRYLDCLAATRGRGDPQTARDLCRQAFIGGLVGVEGVSEAMRQAADERLEAVEFAFDDRT